MVTCPGDLPPTTQSSGHLLSNLAKLRALNPEARQEHPDSAILNLHLDSTQPSTKAKHMSKQARENFRRFRGAAALALAANERTYGVALAACAASHGGWQDFGGFNGVVALAYGKVCMLMYVYVLACAQADSQAFLWRDVP